MSYMNTSRRTAILTHGIYLWAKCMDMPYKDVEGSLEKTVWDEWSRVHGEEMAKLAQDTQFRLFDEVNGRRWA